MVNNKLVDITGLGRYHEKLKALLNAKENVGAAAGAAALQESDLQFATYGETDALFA